jgi:hypothetical protein
MTHLLVGLFFFICGAGTQDAWEHRCYRALWTWIIAATVLGAVLTCWEVFK